MGIITKNITLLLFITFSFFLSAGGKVDNPASNESIDLIGIVKVKGHMPHTFLVLEAENGKDYLLTGELAETLRAKYQRKTVRLFGNLKKEAQGKKMAEIEITNFELLDKINLK